VLVLTDGDGRNTGCLNSAARRLQDAGRSVPRIPYLEFSELRNFYIAIQQLLAIRSKASKLTRNQ